MKKDIICRVCGKFSKGIERPISKKWIRVEDICKECSQKSSIKNNQRKKDDEALHVSHLGTRNTEEEDKTMKYKTDVVDNHVDTDTLSNRKEVIDGHRKHPQDCSGKANVAAKEDTNKCVLPVDSKLRTHRKCDDKYFDELNKDELDS